MKVLHTLYTMLDAFERGENGDDMFIVQLPTEELPQLAAWFNGLPEAEREALRERLENLVTGIQFRKKKMQDELSRIQREVLAGQKTVQANIAYLTTTKRKPELLH